MASEGRDVGDVNPLGQNQGVEAPLLHVCSNALDTLAKRLDVHTVPYRFQNSILRSQTIATNYGEKREKVKGFHDALQFEGIRSFSALPEAPAETRIGANPIRDAIDRQK